MVFRKLLAIFCLAVTFSGCAKEDNRKKQKQGEGDLSSKPQVEYFEVSPKELQKGAEDSIKVKWKIINGKNAAATINDWGEVELDGFRMLNAPASDVEFTLHVTATGIDPFEVKTNFKRTEIPPPVAVAPITREFPIYQVGDFKVQEQILNNLDGAARYRFVFGDYNNDGVSDLYAIKCTGTGNCGTTSFLSIYNGAQNFDATLLADKKLPDNFLNEGTISELAVDRYNNDDKADLYVFKKGPATGTSKTEVHVLGGPDYTGYLRNTGTVISYLNNYNQINLVHTDPTINYNPRILVVSQFDDPTKAAQFAITDNAVTCQSDCVPQWMFQYQSFINPTAGNPFPSLSYIIPTKLNWRFLTNDFNGDKKSDLIAIKFKETDSKAIELMVLDGARSYSQKLLEATTKMAPLTSGENVFFENFEGSRAIFILWKDTTKAKFMMTIYKL